MLGFVRLMSNRRVLAAPMPAPEAAQSDPIGVRLIDVLGEDNVMWGSDFPHPDGVWPDSSGVHRAGDGGGGR